MNDLKESTRHAYMDEMLRRLHKLRADIHNLQREERELAERMKRELAQEPDFAFFLEGIGTAKVIERGRGILWDSAAIKNIIERYPLEWERLVDVGAVKLDTTTMRNGVKNGQLAGLPEGGVETIAPTLVFEDERPRRPSK